MRPAHVINAAIMQEHGRIDGERAVDALRQAGYVIVSKPKIEQLQSAFEGKDFRVSGEYDGLIVSAVQRISHFELRSTRVGLEEYVEEVLQQRYGSELTRLLFA